MRMSNGQVFHGSRNNVEILCYEGDVRHTLCMALDRYLTKLCEKEDLLGFVVDLTLAEGIDSTNLGILARLARMMQKRGLPKVTLISTDENINELLTAVGFDSVFNIVHHNMIESDDMDEIPSTDMDARKMQKLFLDSHRELMELNSQNKEMFKDVVAAFERDRLVSNSD
jgi:anti-anti-sigma factor